MKYEIIRMGRGEYSATATEMYRERKKIFVDRLGWNLNINSNGLEVDEYDDEKSVYIILNDDHRNHLGSIRIRPAINGSMIQDHFHEMLSDRSINNARTWELSRLFVSRNTKYRRSISQMLMWAAARFALHHRIGSLASITTSAHIRWFSRFGWNPEIIGQGQTPEGPVSICLSEVNHAAVEVIERLCKIDQSMVTSLGRVVGFEQDEGRCECDDGPEVSGGLLAA